jgi:hypothetical protein
MAAEYVAGEFARYGLKRSVGVDLPGMSILEADSPRRYMQEFPYVAGVELGQGNALTAKTGGAVMTLRVGEDWMPLGFSSNGRAEDSRAVFVGYGITSAELKYDDYAGADVKDKIALALYGTPDGDNPHGKFAHAGDIRFKAAAARAAGAKALVLIAKEENFKDDGLSHLTFDNVGGAAGLPVIAISKQVAAKWLNTKDAAGISKLEGFFSKFFLNWIEVAQSIGDDKRIVGYGNIDARSDEKTMHYEIPDLSLTLAVDIARKNAPAWNVVGIIEGSDPKLKNEAIVIGAHYDHLGRGGEGSLASRDAEVHHGADDNASGVAGMLELARIFSKERERPRRTIIFIAFSGEEEGLLGSSFYVNHPLRPLAQNVAMINLDMIGRLKEDKLIVGGVGTARQWREIIERANLHAGFSPPPVATGGTGEGEAMPRPLALTLNEDGYGPSDHASFYAKQVPVLFFWTGTHEDYHKPSDTADKINYAGEARIISFAAAVLSSIDESAERPAYTVARSEQAGRSMGFRVYLGTIPNYSDSTTGLVLDGVRDDSPAAKAGLKAGDRIVKMAGRDVRNVYDYTYALGEMKPGQEYEVELVRPGGQTLKLKITPAARK